MSVGPHYGTGHVRKSLLRGLRCRPGSGRSRLLLLWRADLLLGCRGLRGKDELAIADDEADAADVPLKVLRDGVLVAGGNLVATRETRGRL